MSFAATISSKEGRGLPMGGPLKYEIHTWTAASADTSGTVTSKNLHTVYQCIIDGVQQTALPVCSGNTAVLAFVDPAATVYGTLILVGV